MARRAPAPVWGPGGGEIAPVSGASLASLTAASKASLVGGIPPTVSRLASAPGASKLHAGSAVGGASGAAVVAAPRPQLCFTLRLVVHPKSFSSEDIILNPKSVPGLRVGDIIEIFQHEPTSTTGGAGANAQQLHQPRPIVPPASSLAATSKNAASAQPVAPLDPHNALFIKVQSLEPVKANFDLSISSTLADLFALQGRKDIILRTLHDESLANINFLEISFKNQYIGRSDNWRIKHFLQAQSVFSGQPIQIEGMKLRVDEILINGRPAKSGLITTTTRFTFRSRSARLFFLIQLSEESWDFADDGELYFEKIIGFLKILFTEWQKLKVTHALSIIFFSRSYLEVDEEWTQRQRQKEQDAAFLDEEDEEGDESSRHRKSHDSDSDDEGRDPSARAASASGASSHHSHHHRPHPTRSSSTSPPVQIDPNSGKMYQDHYMVVIDCEVFDPRNWEHLLKVLKKKFNKYHLQLKWGLTDPATGLRSYPSTASDGNFLEAINASVSVYDKHYLDRDLYKTGQNIVLFSAGIGMFVVDAKLARLTKQRMVDGGIGCDLICMTRPPLHSVPLFAFKGHAPATPSVGFTPTPNNGSSGSYQQFLHKEQSKLSRAQTGPAASFAHQRRGSSSSAASHHLSALHAVIQEGEEGEEKNGDTTSSIGVSMSASPRSHSNGVTTVSPMPSSAAGSVHSISPPVGPAIVHASSSPIISSPDGITPMPPSTSFASNASATSTSTNSSVFLPPPSDLDATRANPSPSPPVPYPSTSSSASPSYLSPPPPSTAGPHAGSLLPVPSAVHHSIDVHATQPLLSIRMSSAATGEREISRTTFEKSEVVQPQYSVPHWLSIYFYDYQDLYDTPFGSLKTSHRDDLSRNRNEEFVSLSSVKLFDFFDLSFFQQDRHHRPSLVPYYPAAREIVPPQKSHLFDAYDATIFTNHLQPIGLIQPPPTTSSLLPQHQQLAQLPSPSVDTWKSGTPGPTSATPHPSPSPLAPAETPLGLKSPAMPAMPTPTPIRGGAMPGYSSPAMYGVGTPLSTSTRPTPPLLALGAGSGSTFSGRDISATMPTSAFGDTPTKRKLGKKVAIGSDGANTNMAAGNINTTMGGTMAPRPSATTSGPNVALQQHVQQQTQGGTTKTAFQTRWGHLFGELYATLDHLHNPLRPNWKSLCQPAVLPLTTSYWPTKEELKNYYEYNHTLVLVQDQNDYNNNTAALLEEVACQRQAQDYQHIVSSEAPPARSGEKVIYFSLRNQLHQITLDLRANTIAVKRYVHKSTLDTMKLPKVPYSYFLWSPHTNSFLSCERDIEPSKDEFKWSDADNLLCDRYSVDLAEEMKYRRNHYAIIPAGIPAGHYPSEYALSSPTSKHFRASADALRAKYEDEWRRESEKRIAALKAFFTFMFAERGDKIVAAVATATAAAASAATTNANAAAASTSANNTAIASNSSVPTSSPTSSPALAAVSKEKQDKALAAQRALDQAFDSFGIEIDRTHDRLPIPLPAVKPDAERATDEVELAEYLDSYENALGFAIADVRTREMKIPLTKPTVGPGVIGEKADSQIKRYEWFQFQYDTVYNPHAVYHMEIKWIVATGMHLESWIKNFIKKAETRFGLQIVKIPTNQPLRTADSFHVPVPLPVPDPHILRLLEEYLIVECGFVMDSELAGGCRQYIHESGMSAVRRLPSGLVWIPNHLPSASQHRKASVHLFIKIHKHAQHLAQMRARIIALVQDATAFADLQASIEIKKR